MNETNFLNCSDWVLIGTSLFLGFVALFVPYLAELVKRRAFTPELLIIHDNQPPFSLKTFWSNRRNPEIKDPVYFFRFRVSNEGKSQARRCEAIIENLWLFDSSGKPQIIEKFSPVHLRYDEIGTRFVDINPERKIFWNIGHISSSSRQKQSESNLFIDVPGDHSDQLRLLFDLLEYPHSQPNCLVPGKYGICIKVYSENAGTHEFFLQIDWSGKWQSVEKDMLREIVITKVSKFE